MPTAHVPHPLAAVRVDLSTAPLVAAEAAKVLAAHIAPPLTHGLARACGCDREHGAPRVLNQHQAAELALLLQLHCACAK